MAMAVRRGAQGFGGLQPNALHGAPVLTLERVDGIGFAFPGHEGKGMVTGQLRPLRHAQYPELPEQLPRRWWIPIDIHEVSLGVERIAFPAGVPLIAAGVFIAW